AARLGARAAAALRRLLVGLLRLFLGLVLLLRLRDGILVLRLRLLHAVALLLALHGVAGLLVGLVGVVGLLLRRLVGVVRGERRKAGGREERGSEDREDAGHLFLLGWNSAQMVGGPGDPVSRASREVGVASRLHPISWQRHGGAPHPLPEEREALGLAALCRRLPGLHGDRLGARPPEPARHARDPARHLAERLALPAPGRDDRLRLLHQRALVALPGLRAVPAD